MILCAIIFILIAIILGAFASHGLKSLGIPPEKISSFETGVRYLFYNGLGLMAVAGVFGRFEFSVRPFYRAILWGTILFSGSIFALVLMPVFNLDLGKYIGPVTPVGGGIIIFGWFVLLAKFLRTYTTE